MKLHLTAGALLLLAAACTTPVDRSSAPSFGEAVRMNVEAQTTPSSPTMEPPEGDGAQGAEAQTRYKTGQTRPLLPASTSAANPTSGSR
jgi:hypothetical protein